MKSVAITFICPTFRHRKGSFGGCNVTVIGYSAAIVGLQESHILSHPSMGIVCYTFVKIICW